MFANKKRSLTPPDLLALLEEITRDKAWFDANKNKLMRKVKRDYRRSVNRKIKQYNTVVGHFALDEI